LNFVSAIISQFNLSFVKFLISFNSEDDSKYFVIALIRAILSEVEPKIQFFFWEISHLLILSIILSISENLFNQNNETVSNKEIVFLNLE
jgi:hypothetical protein